tara:strand:+ start:540 stop:1019 length:480 start_codon:yes stop_codon:yes gene_type:complete
MNIGLYENVIVDVKSYKEDILKEGFEDILIGEDLFQNVKARGVDELVEFLFDKYPNYTPDLNFVRCSPWLQEEPNFIHTDEMMGDLTAILFLNEKPPEEDGTTLYYKGDKSCILKARFNRLIVFNSNLYHSRNIYDNYGHHINARLIQVVFLKKNISDE